MILEKLNAGNDELANQVIIRFQAAVGDLQTVDTSHSVVWRQNFNTQGRNLVRNSDK